MADREFLDLFVRLKGEVNQLEKLKTRGIDVKVNMSFNRSSGGAFSQLEKLRKGFDIKVKLNLRGKGYDKLKELQKGITIPVKFQYTQKDVLSTASKKGTSTQQKSAPANINVAKRYQPSQVSRLTARKASGDLSQYADQILDDAISSAITTRSATKARSARGIGTSRVFTTASKGVLNFLDKRSVQALQKSVAEEIAGTVYPTTKASTRTGARYISSVPNRAITSPTQSIQAFDELGKELKKLNSEKKKSDVRSFRSPIPINYQENPSESSFEARNRFIQERATARRQSRAFRERLRSARLAKFNREENFAEAQNEYNLASGFFSDETNRKKIARRFGILPRELQPQKRGAISSLTKGIIDPNRLADPETIREIGFAALFGQGIFGKLAGVSGAVVGGSVGRGGAFLGATAAELALETFRGGLEKVTHALEIAFDAGLQFEQSIVGIGSVLQATTSVTGPGGQVLPVGDQLQFQEGKARDIQLRARKELLPLGIGGETEAAIVQGIITGFAQKGIQITPDQIATLARRIGGATQAQRPDLLANINRLRLEIEDTISQPFRRTALTPVVRGFAPGLGTASSGEEAVRATLGLEPFAQALTGNKNSPVQALRQLNTQAENIKVNVGSEYLKALTPAIKNLIEVVSDPKVQSSLTDIARSVAEFLVFLSNVGLKIAKSLPTNAEGSGKLTGGIGGALAGGAVGGGIGATFGGIGAIPGFLIGAATSGIIGGLGGSYYGGKLGLAGEAAARRREEAAKREEEKLSKFKSTTNPLTLLSSLLGAEGSPGPGGASSILSANLGAELLDLTDETIRSNTLQSIAQNPDSEARLKDLKRLPKDIATQRAYFEANIAAQRTLGLADLQERKRDLFDTSLASGVAKQAQTDVSFFGARSQSVQKEISALENLVKTIKEEEQTTDLAQRVSNAKRLIEAEENLSKKREELTSLTLKTAEATKKFSEAISQREQELLSGVDQGTLVGQERAAEIRKRALDARQLELTIAGDRYSPETRQLKQAQLDVAKKQEARAAEQRNLSNAQIYLSAESSLFGFNRLYDSLADKLTSYQNALAESEIGIKQANLGFTSIGLSFRELDLSAKNLSRSITLFEAGVQSRTLGGEAEIIGLEEQLLAAGGAPTGAADLSLVKGSSVFNQTARSLFEQRLIGAKIDEARVRQDQLPGQIESERAAFKIQQEQLALQRQELDLRKEELPIRLSEAKLRAQQAQRNLDGFSIEAATDQLQYIKQLTDIREVLPADSDVGKRVQEAIQTASISDVFKGFGGYENFKGILDAQKNLKGAGFDDIIKTMSSDISVSLPSIDEAVKSIRDIVQSLYNERKDANKDLEKEAKYGPRATSGNNGGGSYPSTTVDDIIYQNFLKKGGVPGTATPGTTTGGTSPSGVGTVSPGIKKVQDYYSGQTPPQPPKEDSPRTTILKSMADLPKGGGPIASKYSINVKPQPKYGDLIDPLTYDSSSAKPGVSGYGFNDVDLAKAKKLYQIANDPNENAATRKIAMEKYYEVLKSNPKLRVFGASKQASERLGLMSISNRPGVSFPKPILETMKPIPDTSLPVKPSEFEKGAILTAGLGHDTETHTDASATSFLGQARTDVEKMSPEAYQGFIQKLAELGYSSEVIDVVKKWRYPPGSGAPNVLDTFKTMRKTSSGRGKDEADPFVIGNVLTDPIPAGSSASPKSLNVQQVESGYGIAPGVLYGGASPAGSGGIDIMADLAIPSTTPEGYKKFVSSGGAPAASFGYKKFVDPKKLAGQVSYPDNKSAGDYIAPAILGGLSGTKFPETIREMGKLPQKPDTEAKTQENKEIGAQILAALEGINMTLQNPQGMGTQVKQALNSTFAGGN